MPPGRRWPFLLKETQPSLRELTPRELEILRLVATGRSNAEIATALTISEATMKTHVNRTTTKLALTSRRSRSPMSPVQSHRRS
ncbi:response regulator transcription factor [Lentzea kentuckyensis]|uniref:response regulator transcription factor n=1 Tax=Lentzea kentuckyensis TaxID=360086 RepID=UPI001B803009